MTDSMPFSSSLAAAVRPAGPAPMMHTGALGGFVGNADAVRQRYVSTGSAREYLAECLMVDGYQWTKKASGLWGDAAT